MPPAASTTETRAPAPLGPLTWLALLAVALTAPSLLRGERAPWRVAAAAVGAAALLLRLVAPRALAGPARALDRGLRALADVVSTAALTAAYLALLVPYARLLRALGRVPSSDEPWPPPETSGWTALDAAPSRHRAAASVLARLVVRAGGAASLVAFLWRRPSYFLVPLVLLALALSAVIAFGSATGLGPLIYTMF